MAMELAQRRRAFVECIQTLLLMGASIGAKVTIKTTGERFDFGAYKHFTIPFTFLNVFSISAGSKKWSHVSSHGF